MYLVENEEGNFFSHGHHNHTSQDHMMNGTSEKKDESIALLKYMLEHNL